MLHNVDGAASLASFAGEVAVLSRLSHPNIVRFLGACLTPPNACLIEEIVEGGSLHACLHGAGAARLAYAEVLSLAEDIASALAYLHPRVVHRDLKSQNVLLDNGRRRAKVCDFGLAKAKQHTFLSTLHVGAGTPAYMAPELFAGGSRVTERVDVWAFGTLLWEMYTARLPWGHLTSPVQARAGRCIQKRAAADVARMQVIFAIAVQRERLPVPDTCPPELAELMRCAV